MYGTHLRNAHLEDQRDYFYTILEKNTATEEHVNDKIG
jgi:hypothetical protein